MARLGVSRTYQNLALFKGLSVFENVESGRASRTRSNFLEQVLSLPRARREIEDARAHTERVIERMDLASIADRAVGDAAVRHSEACRACACARLGPRLLLLDEPMAGMTAGEKAQMAAYVRSARDEFGATIVLIEHDIGVVMGLSDRIAVLDYGRKIADGLARRGPRRPGRDRCVPGRCSRR